MNKIQIILIISIIIGIVSSFTPSQNTIFYEDFQSGSSKWVNSKNPKYQQSIVEIKSSNDPVDASDKGMVLTLPAKHYAMTSKFLRPIDNTDKEITIQYEVQLQNGMECGGAYIKLYTASENFEPENVDNNTPYSIMFGPDKCGGDNKVHFIVRHKSPLTGEFQEKHISTRVPIKNDVLTHLYTLNIKPDNTFNIYIDEDIVVANGNFHTDFTPAFNPPANIDDPEDKKPEDWVDEEKIPEPGATKPEDWDESQPLKIIDESAEKPSDWLDNEPLIIENPEDKKPEEWNDEDDGEWEPSMITNPKCLEGNCGEWEAPMINNPLYKGKWSAPMIDNPEYKGKWAPKKIPNPEYYEVENPYIVEKIGAIGVEVWTMSANVLFDNFIITYDRQEAKTLAKESFQPKHKLELARKKQQEEEAAAKLAADQGYIEKAKYYFDVYMKHIQSNPLTIVITVTALVIPIAFCLGRPSKKSPTTPSTTTTTTKTTPQTKEESSDEEESSEEEEEKQTTKKRTNKVK